MSAWLQNSATLIALFASNNIQSIVLGFLPTFCAYDYKVHLVSYPTFLAGDYVVSLKMFACYWR
jgi:hypothetical protein